MAFGPYLATYLGQGYCCATSSMEDKRIINRSMPACCLMEFWAPILLGDGKKFVQIYNIGYNNLTEIKLIHGTQLVKIIQEINASKEINLNAFSSPSCKMKK